MLPTLAAGERILVRRGPWLRPGDLGVLRDPAEPSRLLVKRVASLDASGIVVLGDNPGASRDSRTFGPVPRALVVGRAWYRYAPAADAGLLRHRSASRLGRRGDRR